MKELLYQYCFHKFEQKINTSLIGDRVVESCCAQLTAVGNGVMNIPGAISITHHTHFRGNKR